MKKGLLILIVAVLSSANHINAQKTWNFSDDTTNWTTSTVGYSTNTVKDNLGIYPGVTITSPTIGGIIPNNLSFSDGFNAARYFRMGQASVFTGNQPTERFLYFATTGAGNIKIWFTSGGGGSRSIKVTDGTNVIGEASSANSATGAILDVPYTQANGNIFIYCSVGTGVNIYKIEVTGTLGTTGLLTSLGTNDFKADEASNVFSNGKQVFVSNVKSSTAIEVYNMTGVLVKSFKVESDTSFELNTGLYVVKAKSTEGEKSAKVVVE